MSPPEKPTSGRGRRDLRVRVKTAKGRKLSSTLLAGAAAERPLCRPRPGRGLSRPGRLQDHRARRQVPFPQARRAGGRPRSRAGRLDASRRRPGERAGKRAGQAGRAGARHRPRRRSTRSRAPISMCSISSATAPMPRCAAGSAAGPTSVMSDMAAAASGHAQTDHLRIMALCEAALDFAVDVLEPGGIFVAKVLAGGAESDLVGGSTAPSPASHMSNRRRAARVPRRNTSSPPDFVGARRGLTRPAHRPARERGRPASLCKSPLAAPLPVRRHP